MKTDKIIIAILLSLLIVLSFVSLNDSKETAKDIETQKTIEKLNEEIKRLNGIISQKDDTISNLELISFYNFTDERYIQNLYLGLTPYGDDYKNKWHIDAMNSKCSSKVKPSDFINPELEEGDGLVICFVEKFFQTNIGKRIVLKRMIYILENESYKLYEHYGIGDFANLTEEQINDITKKAMEQQKKYDEVLLKLNEARSQLEELNKLIEQEDNLIISK